jgi:hypothetical protein
MTVTYRAPTERQPLTITLAGAASGDLAPLQDPPPAFTNGIGWSEFGNDYALLAVSTFNFYDAAGHARFSAFVDQFFDEVAVRQSPHVILDLRGNGGGDPYCGSILISHLLAQAHAYFATATPYYPDLKVPVPPSANVYTGPLSILTNGGCFSTTGHVCSLLSYYQRGPFIGEETGGSFACTAATQTATLDRTQLRFTYSTLTFSTAVSGLTPGRGIMPDYRVAPTVDDTLAGRDVVKAFALSLFRSPATPPVISAAPQSRTIAAGGTVVLDVDATGSALRYQWSHDGVAIDRANSRSLVLTQCTAADAGEYQVTVTNPQGAVTSVPARLGVEAATNASALVNLSVRTNTAPGDQVLTVGVALGEGGETGTNQVLLRGVGPALRGFSVPNVIADPSLRLFRQGSSTLLTTNDDWAGDSSVCAAVDRVGAFPLSDAQSKDAAFLANLGSDLYSVQVPSGNGTTGTVLAEVYAVSPADASSDVPRLTNVSARALVDDAHPLIAGFALSGPAAKTVLIRAVGPGLQSFVGNSALEDPKLTLFRHGDAGPVVIAENDDWCGDPQVAAIAHELGAFALPRPAGKDAAILTTLEPGLYSVHLTRATGSGGLALVEVYAAR